MVITRPHYLEWRSPDGLSGQDPATGYPTPGIPGELKSVPCRFHLGGTKVFKNHDNTEVAQVGRIRLDVGSEMPVLGQSITVIAAEGGLVFKGIVRDIYLGQLSYRIDV